MITLIHEEFVVTRFPDGSPETMATLTLNVEYDWEPYYPGHDECPPEGGSPSHWEAKIESAVFEGYYGDERNATEAELVMLQEMFDKTQQDWVTDSIINYHERIAHEADV